MLLAGLSVMALTASEDSYAGIGIVLIAIVIGVPLLVLGLVCSLYLHSKNAAGRGLLLGMWLPVVASASIFPIAVFWDVVQQASFDRGHPNIREIHINLSGRDQWLDPRTSAYKTLEGKEPGKFIPLERQPALNHHTDPMQAYAGALLAPGFASMTVFYAEPKDGPGVVVPVTVAPAPKDWAPILAQLGTRYADQLVYYYYHYPDRVEVATAINWNDGSERSPGKDVPMANFYLHNLGSQVIVRLEVNGQSLSFPGGRAIDPMEAARCDLFPAPTIMRLDAPLTLRWQYAQTDPAWHQGTLAVPRFRSSPTDERSEGVEAVDLYFLADGSVSAQRSQQLKMGSGKRGIRYTAAAPAINPPPLCGMAAEREGDAERQPD